MRQTAGIALTSEHHPGHPVSAVYDNGSLISSCSHKVLGSRSATCRVTYAAAESHAIKAHYSGYADYAGSTSPTLTETVKTPATTSVPISPR